MKTTVDAFGTEVLVGDTVVFFSEHRTLQEKISRSGKDLRKGEVVKCTPHGATVFFGEQKVSVRSGRIYKVSDGQQRLELDTNESIIIPKRTYDALVLDRSFLEALEDTGVDNWEGYDIAREAVMNL